MDDQKKLTESILQDRLPDMIRVHCFDEIDSTNDFGKELAATNQLFPALIYAHRQTKGRGRGANVWISDAGSLTFSLLVKAEEPASHRFALTWGLAIATALNNLCDGEATEFMVKWPNDVYVCDRKVAGVLIESVASRPDCLVVGIGLNVTTDEQTLKEAIPQTANATSVWEATGVDICRLDLLETIWREFNRIQSLSTESWREQFAAMDYLKDKQLELEQGSNRFRGEYHGLAESLALQLVIDGEIREFNSGSVCVIESAG